MYCRNCGAEVTGGNFCPYCGQALDETTTSISLMNKAVSTANEDDQYSVVLVSCGTGDKTTVGDLLEDVFGYTDAESSNLVNMAPVVVGERLTAKEAQTVSQLLTEYGAQVSITDQEDQYVDLTENATSSVFDNNGNLLASAAAIIGALTVANRIKSYRRFKKPSLLERLFRINYQPHPPVYHRNFRPRFDAFPLTPRQTIRKGRPVPHMAPPAGPAHRSPASHGPAGGHGGHSPAGGPGGRGGHSPAGGPGGHRH